MILDTIKTQEYKLPVKKEKIGFMPWVLINRADKLVQEINTNSKNFSIELYDNGTIDNDSITVYDNKKMILDRMRLTYTPIRVDLEFNNDITEHEIIVVAHNLGIVPPNTALLVVKDKTTKEEFFINTNFQTNAKIIVRYSP
jgi:CRISPR/Cas system CMR subunit Cmr4 (Cas7 group RAMP superfamily)